MFLGYVIAVVALLGFKNVTLTTLLVPICLLAVPILDTLFAIIRRTLKGQPIFSADRCHFHHQLLGMNFSHRTTVLIVYLINIMFALTSIFYVLKDPLAATVIYIILTVIVVWFVCYTNIITEKKPPKLKDIRKKCRSYLKTNNFEELLKNNDKMTKIQLDLEKQLTKVKNDISQQTIFVDKLYKDKLKGLIDEEMFKRQYNNLTNETYNLKKKSNEIETKLFNIKSKTANKDNTRYTGLIKEYLKLKKPSKKLLSSLISKIEIDEEQNVNICYKIKPLY